MKGCSYFRLVSVHVASIEVSSMSTSLRPCWVPSSGLNLLRPSRVYGRLAAPYSTTVQHPPYSTLYSSNCWDLPDLGH
eukprot:scaffold1491_cov167-Ochromonas_danica.AAC.2